MHVGSATICKILDLENTAINPEPEQETALAALYDRAAGGSVGSESRRIVAGWRVAVVHDWLLGMRGGEHFLESALKLFPSADIYTLFHDPARLSDALNRRAVFASPLNRLPGVKRYYRYLLPLLPRAIESLRIGDSLRGGPGYDLVFASSHCVAHGVTVPPGARRVIYCHSPMRYLYDQREAYERGGLGPAAAALRLAAPRLRRWDAAAARRHPGIIANSNFVAARIERVYGLEARVVNPPVRSDFFTPGEGAGGAGARAGARDGAGAGGDGKTRPDAPRTPAARRAMEGFAETPYLVVSALAPYKRVDVAIEAANRLGKPLLVAGTGQAAARLRAMAGPTVRFAGWVDDATLRDLYRACAALIFPGEEDFGITPLEAMACGKPVLGLGSGGLLETVRAGVVGRPMETTGAGTTGAFFAEPTVESLAEAWREFDPAAHNPAAIRAHAETFGEERFLDQLAEALVAPTR